MATTDVSFRASATDAFTLTFIRVAARAGSFLFFVLLASLTDPALVGEYALFVAIALVLSAFVDYGLPTLVTSDVSRAHPVAESPLRAALRVRLALVVIVCLSATLAVSTDRPAHLWFLAVVAAIVLDGYGSLLLAGARRDRRLRAIAAVEVTRSWTALLALLPLSMLGTSGTASEARPWVYSAFVIGSALALLVAFAVSRGFLKDQLGHPAASSRRYWRAGFPLAVATVAVGLNNRVDLMMLNWLADENNVAYYAGAYLFVSGAILIPVMASYAVLPALSRADSESAERFRELLRSWVRSLTVTAVLVGVALAALATLVIDIFYAPSYRAAVNALRVLAIALPAMFVSNLYWNALVVVGRQKTIVSYIMVAAVVNALANFLLIPRIGLLGAAASTVLAEFLVALRAARALTPYAPLGASPWHLTRSATSVATAATVAWATGAWGMSSLSIALSIVSGVTIAWVLGVIRSDDLRIAFQVIRGSMER